MTYIQQLYSDVPKYQKLLVEAMEGQTVLLIQSRPEHYSSRGARPPGAGEGTYLALTFSNRYLTPAKFAEGEPVADLSLDVDPFNILRPLLTNQVHLQENVVEYWEQESVGTSGQSFRHIKPDLIVPGTMVELQVAFAAVKLGRKDFVFLPKLRAICVLNRVVQAVCVRTSSWTVSDPAYSV
ncbi:hypothetical protein BV20DRAFT_1056968 [Pilatotrama ljubarskyi]|nr:hypothetical protein BV20DRAFT_1056968 [Pilatotrama ljubarskyi]